MVGQLALDQHIGVRLPASQPRLFLFTNETHAVNPEAETGQQDARAMTAVVRMNANDAGVYAAVVRAGWTASDSPFV